MQSCGFLPEASFEDGVRAALKSDLNRCPSKITTDHSVTGETHQSAPAWPLAAAPWA
jgi:hypothetical protein